MKINIFLIITIFLTVLISSITGCKEGGIEITPTITPIATVFATLNNNTPVVNVVTPTMLTTEKPSGTPVLKNTPTLSPVSPTSGPDNSVLDELPLLENYVFVSHWGSKGSDEGEFDFPMGIILDNNENVYVADYSNRRIQKFTSDGEFMNRLGSDGSGEGQFHHGPKEITVSSFDGSIYIIDADRIQKFTSEGKFVTQWKATSATSVAVDPENKWVYVSNIHCVGKYDLSGKFIKSWWSFPDLPGRLPDTGCISGIALNSKNNIIALHGNSMESMKLENEKWVHAGWFHEFTIIEFDPDGYTLKRWGSEDKKIEGNPDFTSIALDKEDNIYMTDWENDCVWKFSSDGNLLARWGSSGSGEGQFNNPDGIAADSEGNVYVADTRNNRIQKFRPE